MMIVTRRTNASALLVALLILLMGATYGCIVLAARIEAERQRLMQCLNPDEIINILSRCVWWT